jgi:hypothetical protein
MVLKFMSRTLEDKPQVLEPPSLKNTEKRRRNHNKNILGPC